MSDEVDLADEACRWLTQAREDLVAAKRIASDDNSPARIACFLAHLVAENALKAVLVSSGTPFRKAHDLYGLISLMPTAHAAKFNADDLDLLNPWSIEGRYPEDLGDAATHDRDRCIEAAERTLDAAVTIGSTGSSSSDRGSSDADDC